MQRAVGGDQRAFELLVIKYQRRLQRLIGRMVRDSDMVEDVLFEKKLYDVAKDGCVYYYDEKREGHIWTGYLGVGKFHNMKLHAAK